MKEKGQKAKTGGDASYSESVRAKWFCCAFKLGVLQLIGKASLIFKDIINPYNFSIKNANFSIKTTND